MIYPSRSDLTFKGRISTNVSLTAMPTLFSDDTSGNIVGGYHLTLDSIKLGSQVDKDGFQYNSGLFIRFFLKQTDATFFIRHLPAQTFAIFLTSLLGALTALVAGVGAALAAVETCQSWYHRAQELRQKRLRQALDAASPLDALPKNNKNKAEFARKGSLIRTSTFTADQLKSLTADKLSGIISEEEAQALDGHK
eukprot:TRINITY_DN6619_c0_g1_i3.p1 TRINITY_DN6619_c0_g1~~TRINITY_DN6619_c0_g1_i3.p1  ORF type:complete len:195 (+),score=44.00 TRINITY_DN6619_c0_g1_i3:88-672(+)